MLTLSKAYLFSPVMFPPRNIISVNHSALCFNTVFLHYCWPNVTNSNKMFRGFKGINLHFGKYARLILITISYLCLKYRQMTICDFRGELHVETIS